MLMCFIALYQLPILSCPQQHPDHNTLNYAGEPSKQRCLPNPPLIPASRADETTTAVHSAYARTAHPPTNPATEQITAHPQPRDDSHSSAAAATLALDMHLAPSVPG